MTMPDWRFLILLATIAVITWATVTVLYQAGRTSCRGQAAKVFNNLPLSWQRRLIAYAKSQDAFVEPLDVLLKQLAVIIVVGICLLLPLPQLIRLMILIGSCWIVLQARSTRRIKLRRFSQQWPACLDMLAMLLHAGLSFRAALHALASLKGEAVALVQLRLLHQQLLAGVSLEEGLEALKLRMPHPVTNAFVAAVLQSRFTGGALADTLASQAEQVRSEQQLKAEKLAQEVGVKLLLPLVTCFFPVTFLLILGPIFIGFLQPQ